MKLLEAFGRALRHHDVDCVFGLLGDANMFMVDSFVRSSGGSYVAAAHEAGAVLMANGYAQVSGRLGVATVTHGPGLTNTLTPLVEASRNRTPLLLIAGDTAIEDHLHIQRFPQRDVARSAGAGFEQVRTACTAITDIAAAIRRAHAERRPIVLNVPTNFWWQDIDYEPGPRFMPAHREVAADPAALDAAIGALASAARPVVLAGAGVRTPGARAALVRLAGRLEAPLATTLRAKDLFSGEPNDIGIFGTLSTPEALDVIGRADCIISFGAGLNKWTTVSGALVDERRVVQVDVDVRALGRFGPSFGVVGDAETVADTIVRCLDEAELPPTGFFPDRRSPDLSVGRDADKAIRRPDADAPVRFGDVLRRLEVTLPADRTLTCDGGRYVGEALKTLHVSMPRHYVHAMNFGSIGLGMGNAIGAAVGRPGHPVLLTTGDGGFMLGGLVEFNTAVRYNLDITVVIFNDSAYGAEHIQFRSRGMNPDISTFDWPDFGGVANSLGGTGFTVRTNRDLDAAIDALQARNGPVLINVHIDPDSVPALHG